MYMSTVEVRECWRKFVHNININTIIWVGGVMGVRNCVCWWGGENVCLLNLEMDNP